jgi:hypothetical protein
MKTPTVDDAKPKRDKLGPTGPAESSDDVRRKDEETNSAGSAPSYEADIENIIDRKRTQTPPG